MVEFLSELHEFSFSLTLVWRIRALSLSPMFSPRFVAFSLATLFFLLVLFYLLFNLRFSLRFNISLRNFLRNLSLGLFIHINLQVWFLLIEFFGQNEIRSAGDADVISFLVLVGQIVVLRLQVELRSNEL